MRPELALPRRYEADGFPAYWLSRLQRKYRRKFIRAMLDGKIGLAGSACPCGGDLKNIAGKDRIGLPFSASVCVRCGTLVTSPRIAESSMDAYYSDIYFPLVLGHASGKVVDSVVSENQGVKIFGFLSKYLKTGEMHVCEVGCASGSNLVQFREAAKGAGIDCSVYGCEYEGHYVQRAVERGVKAVRGGVDALHGFGRKFDVIILSHVLEHFYDPSRELRALRSLLSDTGLLYIEVPGLMNLSEYENDLINCLVHAHLYNFNLSSLDSLLGLNGFSLLEGDEAVRSVFVKGDEKTLSEPGNAGRVLQYLDEVEDERSKKPAAPIARLKRIILEMFYRMENLFSGLWKLEAIFEDARGSRVRK